MTEYTVTFVNQTDGSITVEADNVAAALEAAEDEFSYPTLCHHCSSGVNGRNDGDWTPTFVTDDKGREHGVP